MEIKLVRQSYKNVEQFYDVQRGYGAQFQSARTGFRRASMLVDTELNRNGLIKRPCFTAQECADLCEKLENGLAERCDPDDAVALIERIISPELDREIISYFESEYTLSKAGFLVAHADEKPSESDGWHCDAGPSRFLRIMLYLTGSEDDAANTLFSDRESTNRLKESGYVFCEVRYRLLDLDPLTNALGMERATVVSLDIQPGDVILFDAPNIMHRRLLPKRASRYVFTITLVPSILPWREVVAGGHRPLSLNVESFPPLPGYAQQ